MPAEHYPPKGKELEVVKKVDKLLEQYRKIDHFDSSPTVFIGHVIDGVRCNGKERVNSLLDVIKKMAVYEQDLKCDIEGHKKALTLTKQIRKAMLGFKVCPKCKGEKGFFPPKVKNEEYRAWEDCLKCNGRGITIETDS